MKSAKWTESLGIWRSDESWMSGLDNRGPIRWFWGNQAAAVRPT